MFFFFFSLLFFEEDGLGDLFLGPKQKHATGCAFAIFRQAWTSHELVSFAAAFILKEWLGYNVELVTLACLARA